MNIFGINAIQIENESDKSKYYGKNVIGYTPQNGSTVGWKIFYIEIQQLNKSYFDQGFTSKNGDINVMYPINDTKAIKVQVLILFYILQSVEVGIAG